MPRFNCCVCNHPCPIFCPFIDLTCQNEVVNPVVSSAFGFFNNLSVGAIASGAQIPVSLVILGGDGGGIVPNAGGVTVTPGTYEINYFAGGTVPAGGTLSIGLTLDGVSVAGSQVSSTQSAGSTVNLTRTIVVSAIDGGTISLVNTSGEAATFSFASMFLRRL